VGNMSLAKEQAKAALALANGKDVEGLSGIVFALAGNSAPATRLAAHLDKRFPQDTIVQTQYLPMIHAADELRSNSASEAVKALMAGAPYELGSPNSLTLALFPAYLRGQAIWPASRAQQPKSNFKRFLIIQGWS
jgi:hypothetical protein